DRCVVAAWRRDAGHAADAGPALAGHPRRFLIWRKDARPLPLHPGHSSLAILCNRCDVAPVRTLIVGPARPPDTQSQPRSGSMGVLVEGVWQDHWYDTKSSGGRFVRQESKFRNWITADGAPGPTGEGGFPAAAGRYHLYVALACPWAHRTLIFRKLKGLERMIDLSIVHPQMGVEGWVFEPGPHSSADTVNGKRRLYEIYLLADPAYSGRATVPVLWDKERRTIVNNESADIIRMFNSAFDAIGAHEDDYYPEALRS